MTNIYLEKVASQNQDVYEKYVQTRDDVEGNIAKKALKGAETGAMIGAGYHILTNKVPAGLGVNEALSYSRRMKKPVLMAASIGAAINLARGIKSEAYPLAKKYKRVADVDGIPEYESAHKSKYLGSAIGGAGGLYAATKVNKHLFNSLHRRLYSKLPFAVQPFAPLVLAGAVGAVGSKIGETAVDGYNRSKADFIRQKYYGQ